MTTKNTGGPAFPLPVADQECCGRFESGYGGMSLRDAMALSVRMPDEFAASWAAALAGSPQPGLGAEPIEHIDWWARAEAAYRYRIADAMLKAREEV